MKYFLNQNIFSDSPYTAAISQGVIRLIEKGVVARLKKKWWEEQRGGGSCKVGWQITQRKTCFIKIPDFEGKFIPAVIKSIIWAVFLDTNGLGMTSTIQFPITLKITIHCKTTS